LLTCLVTVFFQCQPLAFTWDAAIPGGECLPASNLKFAAFFNSSKCYDYTVLHYLPNPFRRCFGFHRSPLRPSSSPYALESTAQLEGEIGRRGNSLSGYIVCLLSVKFPRSHLTFRSATAAAIVKITFLGSYGSHGDFLFDSTDLTIWYVHHVTKSHPYIEDEAILTRFGHRTTVEICTAMIAASIPSLKPLFRSILSGSSAGKYGSRTTKGYMREGDTSGKGTGNRGDASDFEMDNRIRSHTNIKGGARAKYSPDNVSEESILKDGERESDRGIKKTTQIFMTVDERHRRKPKDMV
jgi:hypothetical protein